jgi:anti-anti-sigma factor
MPAKNARSLQIDQLGEVTLVRFNNALLMETEETEDIGKQLNELLQEGKRKFVMDFRNVERVSSGLVAKLISLHKRVETQGGRVVLCHIVPQIQDVFTMLRLPQFLNIYERDVDALQSF